MADVAVVLDQFPRLSERFLYRDFAALEAAGLELCILASKPGATDVVEADSWKAHYFRGPVKSIGLHAKYLFRRPSIYLSSLFRLLPGYRFNLGKAWMRLSMALCFADALQKQNCRLIHAAFASKPAEVAMMAADFSKIPFSFSAHARDIFVEGGDLSRKLAKAQFVLTCTAYNIPVLQRSAAPDDSPKIKHIYHSHDFSDALCNCSQCSGPFHILSIGRLVPKKGFDTLIDALALLKKEGLDFRCEIVGDGPLAGDLERQIVELGLSEEVSCLGRLAGPPLDAAFERADAFALACRQTSDGDMDGIPNVLVEAASMGLPLVSTQVSGIPELIQHGENGLLVPSNDPPALSAALHSLAEQPALRQAFATAGNARAKQMFNREVNGRAFAAVFEKALEGAS